MYQVELDLNDLNMNELIYLSHTVKLDYQDLSREQLIDRLRQSQITVDQIDQLIRKPLIFDPDQDLIQAAEYINQNILILDPSQIKRQYRRILTKITGIQQLIDYRCLNSSSLDQQYRLLDYLADLLLKHWVAHTPICIDQEIALLYQNGDIYCETPCRTINKCQNRSQIVVILTLKITENREYYEHFIVMIIQNNVIELFDPAGISTLYFNRLEEFLSNYLIPKLLNRSSDSFEIIRLKEICPTGIQTVNFCVAYSLLYIWLRLHNPLLTNVEILNGLLIGKNIGIDFLIAKFICMMTDYIYQHQLINIYQRYHQILNTRRISRTFLNRLNNLYSHFDLPALRLL